MSFLELETRRLKMRPLEDGDLPELGPVFSGLNSLGHCSMERKGECSEENQRQLEKLLHSRHEPGMSLHWAAVEKESGKLAGILSLESLPDAPREYHVAYRFSREAQEKGYPHEAANCAMRCAFVVFEQPHVHALASESAGESREMLGRMGFSPVGECEYDGASVTKFSCGREAWAAALER